jgi:hypothetical protein
MTGPERSVGRRCPAAYINTQQAHQRIQELVRQHENAPLACGWVDSPWLRRLP